MNPVQISRRLSLTSLIAVNLIPLAGVLFLGWNLNTILLSYWLESAVIGLWNLVKLFCVAVAQPDPTSRILIPFFVVHYGGFMVIHFSFLSLILSGDLTSMPGSGVDSQLFVQALPFVGSLFVSHGVSFFLHFVRTKAYETQKAAVLFFAPYGRIIVMHLTVLAGGFLMVLFGQPAWALILLVLMKTIVDVLSHGKEHGLFSVS